MKPVLLSILAASSLYASWNPLVQRDSRLDQFIIQISSRYAVPVPEGFYQQPMHREPVERFIRHSLDSLELTAGERADAELLLKWYGGERATLSRSGEKAGIAVNFDLSGDIDLAYSDSLEYGLKGIINPSLNGFIGGLSFASEFEMWTETRNDTVWRQSNYEPYNGYPFNLFGRADTGSVRASDRFRGGVSWKLGLSNWDFGVDHLKSGPAVRNPLLMNFDDAPAAFIRMNLDFPWFDYTHTAMTLQSMRDYDRYMMYHRFEVPLAKKRIALGLNESVVYGSSADSLETAKAQDDPMEQQYYSKERTFQPVYLVPFMPFVFMEHFAGDRENKQLSLDVSVNLPRTFTWYLEFMLDDMSSPQTLFSDDFGNKWAYSAGGKWHGAAGGKNLTVSAEYSRIEPWVYTHFRGISHRYDHFGSPIGSDMGPNSDLFWTETAFQLNQKNRFALSFENQRWNHEQRGGSIDDIFYSKDLVDQSRDSTGYSRFTEDKLTKKFLDGNVQSDQIVKFDWNFLPFHHYDMNTLVRWSAQKGASLGFSGGFRF